MSPATAVILLLLGILGLLIFIRRSQQIHRKFPPGPPRLPLIGNLHLLGTLPHQALHNLAKKYGPIMSIRLGLVPAVIISSPEGAELILKNHDAVFASRPKMEVAEYYHYGRQGIILTEYGSYWRNIRRLCTVKLLNVTKVESFAGCRKREVEGFVESLKESGTRCELVDMSRSVGSVIEDMMCLMIIGRRGYKLTEIIQVAAQMGGSFNLGDFVPFLLPFDLQGLTRRIKAGSKAFDEVLEVIIDEHLREGKQDDSQQGDFIDVLLSMLDKPMDAEKKDSTTMKKRNIKAILVDMIGAAMDTSASAVEWAISELVRNPNTMRRLQNELRTVIGMDRRVEETDLPNLSYLEMVVKETMRLHPPGPLLVPRESMEDVTIDGYFVAKGTRVMVNAWAIGRDKKAWSDNAEEFLPERFLKNDVDLQGKDFQLIPFGAGRRGCPGMRLGLTTVRLLLAQIVHCFDLKMPRGGVASELDMQEKFGLAMPRANHLFLYPTYRLHS